MNAAVSRDDERPTRRHPSVPILQLRRRKRIRPMNRVDLSRALDREVETLRDELIQSTSRSLQFDTVSGATDRLRRS